MGCFCLLTMEILFFSFRVSKAGQCCYPRRQHTCRLLGPGDHGDSHCIIIPWRSCSWREVLVGIWETKPEDLEPGKHVQWCATLEVCRGECGEWAGVKVNVDESSSWLENNYMTSSYLVDIFSFLIPWPRVLVGCLLMFASTATMSTIFYILIIPVSLLLALNFSWALEPYFYQLSWHIHLYVHRYFKFNIP